MLRKIQKTSYANFSQYAYRSKELRKYIEKNSTRRKKPKNYKK